MYIINSKQKIERDDLLDTILAVYQTTDTKNNNQILIQIKDSYDLLYTSDKIDEILNALR